MQFRHLAEQLSNATVGTTGETKWATLLVSYILGPTKLREIPEEELVVLVAGLLTHHNKNANSGMDRCECGCKYWENDRCIDCRGEWDFERHRHGA